MAARAAAIEVRLPNAGRAGATRAQVPNDSRYSPPTRTSGAATFPVLRVARRGPRFDPSASRRSGGNAL